MEQTEKTNSDRTLKRSLSPLHVWALAFGCIIGGSAFFMPANTFLPTAGPLGPVIAMLAAAGIMILIAFNYHYMVNRLPEAGGEFAYARSAFGNRHAFICSWFLSLSYIALVPLNATLLGVVGKYLIGDVFRFGYMYHVAGYDVFAGEVVLSVGTLLFFAWMNVRGIRIAGWMQMILSFALLLGVAAVTTAAFCSPSASIGNLHPVFPAGKAVLPGILAVMAVSPWAFVGFDTIPQTAEEFNFPHTKTRRIMVFAILFGAAVYISLNTVTASVLPAGYADWTAYVEDVQNLSGIDSLPTFHAAKSLLGNGGLFFIGIAVMSAALAGVVGFFVAASRLLFSMARERFLPAWFAKLHGKHATPCNAILFVLAISVIAPFFGRTVLGWVVDMSSIGAAIGFAYTSAATLKSAARERRTGMMISGLIGTICSAVFIVLLLVPIPGISCTLIREEYIALAVWIVIGFIFYMLSAKKQVR